MTDIIIQGICGRMGRALLEKIGVRDDCRVVAGVDREPGHLGEIPIFSDFDALPCRGVIIDFSSPAGAVAAAQYGAANGLPCVICSTGLSKADEAVLEAAIAAWESKSQPEVYRQASRLLSLMTDGRWVKVAMTPEGRLQVMDAVKTEREPVHLSLGTCQQLYLALRIALLITADNVGRSIPILADDILVNFDARRRVGAARALAELARTRQVILFTCHEEIVESMRSADPALNVVEL